MLFHIINVLHLAAQNSKPEVQFSSHVLVSARSERSDWSRLELKTGSESLRKTAYDIFIMKIVHEVHTKKKMN